MHTSATRLHLSCALLLAALLVPSRSAYGDAAPKWTDLQLVELSDVIVRGRVTGIFVGRDDRVDAPYTYVALDLAEVLKGMVSDRRVVLKQLGGRVGSTALEVAGQPTFTVGEEVVVFLEIRPRDRTLTTTAQWLGKFTVGSLGNGVAFAQRQESGTPGRGVFGDDARPLLEWLGELRGAIRDAPLSAAAAAVDVVPVETARAAPALDDHDAVPATWRDAVESRQAVRVDTAAPGQPALADGGERQLRQAAEYWSNTGLMTLATGGLQQAGCFTTREPDGRIVVGVDTCGELNPNGGTLALSGRWLRYDDDRTGARIVGAGVITNGGEMPQRLLGRSSCFEQVATHELGHALGLRHSVDGAGPMGAFLQCDGAFGTLMPTPTAQLDRVPAPTATSAARASRPMLVPLEGDRAAAAGPAGGTLTLAWDPPTTGEPPTAYVIEAGTRSGATDVASFSTGSAATTFSAAVGGSGAYYIRVRAARAGGLSGPSNEVVFGLDGLPNAPFGLAAAVSGSTVILTWSPPGAVTAYTVEAGSAPGGTDLANFSTRSPATIFTAFGVGSGTYFVRVRAENAGAVSPPSNEVPVIVAPNCSAAPGAPGRLAAAVSGSTVTLTWTAGAGATSYVLTVGSRPRASDILQTDLSSAATALTAVNVGANTYFVRLRSRNACGLSGSSNEAVVVIR